MNNQRKNSYLKLLHRLVFFINRFAEIYGISKFKVCVLSLMLFIGLWLSTFLFPVNAQNLPFQVFKFQIENYAKQLSQLKNEEGQVPIIVESVGKKIAMHSKIRILYL